MFKSMFLVSCLMVSGVAKAQNQHGDIDTAKTHVKASDSKTASDGIVGGVTCTLDQKRRVVSRVRNNSLQINGLKMKYRGLGGHRKNFTNHLAACGYNEAATVHNMLVRKLNKRVARRWAPVYTFGLSSVFTGSRNNLAGIVADGIEQMGIDGLKKELSLAISSGR
jgi:hypothetical protein